MRLGSFSSFRREPLRRRRRWRWTKARHGLWPALFLTTGAPGRFLTFDPGFFLRSAGEDGPSRPPSLPRRGGRGVPPDPFGSPEEGKVFEKCFLFSVLIPFLGGFPRTADPLGCVSTGNPPPLPPPQGWEKRPVSTPPLYTRLCFR